MTYQHIMLLTHLSSAKTSREKQANEIWLIFHTHRLNLKNPILQ